MFEDWVMLLKASVSGFTFPLYSCSTCFSSDLLLAILFVFYVLGTVSLPPKPEHFGTGLMVVQARPETG